MAYWHCCSNLHYHLGAFLICKRHHLPLLWWLSILYALLLICRLQSLALDISLQHPTKYRFHKTHYTRCFIHFLCLLYFKSTIDKGEFSKLLQSLKNRIPRLYRLRRNCNLHLRPDTKQRNKVLRNSHLSLPPAGTTDYSHYYYCSGYNQKNTFRTSCQYITRSFPRCSLGQLFF